MQRAAARWLLRRLCEALCAVVLAGALSGVGGAAAVAGPQAQATESGAVAAGLPDPAASDALRAGVATLMLNHRHIIDFHGALLGDPPAERAAAAQAALEEALARPGPVKVTRVQAGGLVRFEVDGHPAFFMTAADVPGATSPAVLEAAALKAERRLTLALQESREATDPRRLIIGAGYAFGATLLLLLLLRGLLGLRRLAAHELRQRLSRLEQQHAQGPGLLATYVPHVGQGLRWLATALSWAAALLLADLWVAFVLNQFAYTRPWGERTTAWLLDVLGGFALGALGAVPGLLTALLVFALARLLARALSLLLQRVESGELHIGWLDADTAAPTRRIGSLVIWLFALALAYPYLPGSSSESFKGVTVLAGLMLSMGASGVVGQAMAGLTLMYARSLRAGEYVRIADTEGTVVAVGMFVTKIHTGMGEEVSLPNTVIVNQPVRNYSRLVADGQFVLSTTVTIGYATPWRQVHALLLEAARRTPGVSASPAPYVVQTALSDFYVEYRLCAQADRSAPRRRIDAMNQLHGHIQDVFNENGVQIMSPHYRADPPEPQVVPPGAWFPSAQPPMEPVSKARPAAEDGFSRSPPEQA